MVVVREHSRLPDKNCCYYRYQHVADHHYRVAFSPPDEISHKHSVVWPLITLLFPTCPSIVLAAVSLPTILYLKIFLNQNLFLPTFGNRLFAYQFCTAIPVDQHLLLI
jgi:hypothetical protein